MTKYRHTDRQVRELKDEIKRLKQSLDITIDLNEVLQKNNNKLDKERINYRRIIKYSTMLMLLMNLITSNSGDTDINKIFNHNINEFYRLMNNDLMKIPNDDNEIIDNEFEDEAERYDEGKSTDLWDGEEEYE
jgi:hypothetical protein